MKKKIFVIYILIMSLFLFSCVVPNTNRYIILYTHENEIIEIEDFKLDFIYFFDKENNEIVYVNEDMLSQEDLLKTKSPGEHDIKVNYLGEVYSVKVILATEISYSVFNPYEHTSVLIEEFNISNIMIIKNIDGIESATKLNIDMLRESDRQKINTLGSHTLTVLFENNTFLISFNLIEKKASPIISIINPYEDIDTLIDNFDLSDIKLKLDIEGDITYIDVKESMIDSEDLEKLNNPGTHYIYINYEDYSQKIKITLIESENKEDIIRYYLSNPYDLISVNIDDFQLSSIKIVIESNSNKEYVSVTFDMLSVSDQNKLKNPGNHEINIVYNDQKFIINIHLISEDEGSEYIYDHIANGYYSSANNLTGNELKLALRTIINTDVKNTSYENLKTWLPLTDPGNRSNTVLLFYLRTSVSATWDGGNTWNREHVWPKSLGWFSNSGAGSDLHHIRPTSPSENSKRGNLKYGEGTSGTYEPSDNVKGDVARILFYMLVRYSQTDNSYPITNVCVSFNMLLEWHEMDPVDSIEIYRNEKAYELQGNRNPFIDFEGFVEYIWG